MTSGGVCRRSVWNPSNPSNTLSLTSYGVSLIDHCACTLFGTYLIKIALIVLMSSFRKIIETLRLLFFRNRKRQDVTWPRVCRHVCRMLFTFQRQDLASRGKSFTAEFFFCYLNNHCKVTFKANKMFLSCLKNNNFWFMGFYRRANFDIWFKWYQWDKNRAVLSTTEQLVFFWISQR